MLHLSRVSLVFIFFLQASLVHGSPIPSKRQGDTVTVSTVHTTMTDEGLVIENCDITLTPIQDTLGKAAVEEVRKCFLTLDDGSEDGSGVTSVPSVQTTATSVVAPASASSTIAPPVVVETATSSGSSSSVTSAPTATAEVTSSASSVSSSSTSVLVPPSASVTSSSDAQPSAESGANTAPTVTTSSSASQPSAESGAAAPIVTASSSASQPSAVSGADTAPTATPPSNTAADTTTGTSAPDSTASATAAFQLPGKTLSVLPIGLGVFAGISVIALIVVGLVTYERTKYRKAFRQRKLAESGAGMGYGGMSQRP